MAPRQGGGARAQHWASSRPRRRRPSRSATLDVETVNTCVYYILHLIGMDIYIYIYTHTYIYTYAACESGNSTPGFAWWTLLGRDPSCTASLCTVTGDGLTPIVCSTIDSVLDATAAFQVAGPRLSLYITPVSLTFRPHFPCPILLPPCQLFGSLAPKIKRGEDTVDWDTVGSNCSIENCLSDVSKTF